MAQRIVYVPSPNPYEEVGGPYEEVKPRSRYNTLTSSNVNTQKEESIYGNSGTSEFNKFRNGPLQAATLPGNRTPAVPPRTYQRIDEKGDLILGGSSTRRGRKRSKRTLNKRKQKKRANRKTKRKSSTY
jgi:hypothetical protein